MRWMVLLLTVVFLFLQYHLWFDEGGILSMWKMKHKVASQQAKVLAVHKKNELLAANIRDLKKGDKLIQAHARSDLGMVKKREVFYRVVK